MNATIAQTPPPPPPPPPYQGVSIAGVSIADGTPKPANGTPKTRGSNAYGALRFLEIAGAHFVLLQPPDFLRPLPGVPYSTTFPSAFEVMLQVEITRPDGTADPRLEI